MLFKDGFRHTGACQDEWADLCIRFFRILILATLMPLLFAASCNKDDNAADDLPLVFESLTAEHDTIPVGGTTRITARATGSKLTYSWSANMGTILGSGEQITYATDPCQAGEYAITCKVQDAKGASEEKSVKVFVKI